MPYIAAFRAALWRGSRDWSGLALRAVFFATLMVAFDALWSAASHNAGAALAQYGHRGMLWYLLGTEVAVVSVPARRIEDVAGDITSGAYEAELLRPAHAWLLRLMNELGAALPQAIGLFAVGIPLVWLLAGPPPDPWSLLVALPAIVLAVVCAFAGLHAFAAVTFWVRDVGAAWFIYQKLVFMIGGMLLPLSFLPQILEATAWALPFQAMAYTPGQLASGHRDLWLLPLQLVWIVVATGLAHLGFVRGERRLIAGRA
jgi:ABC-2 type transport system permease protein